MAMIEKRISSNEYTISDISRITGIARSQIHNWSNGSATGVRDSSMKKVAETLGYDIQHTPQGIQLTEDNNQTKEDADMYNETQYRQSQEINQLLREKISFLEEKLNNQPVQNATKTIITTSLWDTIDYDVQTFQTYDSRDFGYFKSYKIIRWQEFFAKLGYHGDEAKVMYQKHLDSLDIKNKNTDRADGYKNFLLHHEATDSRLYDRDTSNKFFRDERAAHTVSKMTRFNLNYKHKNGSYIPAILHCLFDFDKLTGISKIKFIETD